MREIPLHGLSITMPYKQAILPHLDNTDAHTNKDRRVQYSCPRTGWQAYGFNTDIAGVLRPLDAAAHH